MATEFVDKSQAERTLIKLAQVFIYASDWLTTLYYYLHLLLKRT